MAQRVFIIGPNKDHDYSAAAKFGAVVPLFDSRVNVFNTDILSQDVNVQFDRHNIKAQDVLLLGGSSILNALAIVSYAQRFGVLKFLIFGGRNKDYHMREIKVFTANKLKAS